MYNNFQTRSQNGVIIISTVEQTNIEIKTNLLTKVKIKNKLLVIIKDLIKIKVTTKMGKISISMRKNQIFIKNKTILLKIHPLVTDVGTFPTRLANVLQINTLMENYYQN